MLVVWMEAVGCKVGASTIVEDGVEGGEDGSDEKRFERGDRGIVESRVDGNSEETGKKGC